MATATAVSGFVACVLMGLIGNLPFGIGPGMGINAYFTYTVVGYLGLNGMISYQDALAACFVEGFIFIAISLLGLRNKITAMVPKSIMLVRGFAQTRWAAAVSMPQKRGTKAACMRHIPDRGTLPPDRRPPRAASGCSSPSSECR